MASINSLPPEILGRIISLSDVMSFDHGAWEAHCCSMSLVARSWRWAAQRKLWGGVELISGAQAWALCASEAKGRFVTRQLSILDWDEFSQAAKKRAVEACKGVEVLQFYEGAIPAGILEASSLTSLRELKIGEITINGPFPTSFKFSLTSIDICEDSRLVPLPLVDALIKSSRETLRDLTLQWTNHNDGNLFIHQHLISCLERFEPLAPRLRHLALHCDTPDQTIPTTSFLNKANQLQSLTLRISHNVGALSLAYSILHVLPPSLSTLRLEAFQCDAGIADTIRSQLASHPQLCAVALERYGGDKMRPELESEYVRAEQRLREECEARGVELHSRLW